MNPASQTPPDGHSGKLRKVHRELLAGLKIAFVRRSARPDWSDFGGILRGPWRPCTASHTYVNDIARRVRRLDEVFLKHET